MPGSKPELALLYPYAAEYYVWRFFSMSILEGEFADVKTRNAPILCVGVGWKALRVKRLIGKTHQAVWEKGGKSV